MSFQNVGLISRLCKFGSAAATSLKYGTFSSARKQNLVSLISLQRGCNHRVWNKTVSVNSLRACATTSLKRKDGIQQHISALQAKRQPRRKIKVFEKSQSTGESWLAVAHSTAEEYDLEEIAKDFEEEGVYQPSTMDEELVDVIRITPRYTTDDETREFYLFREGSVVFWNVPEIEILSVLRLLKKFERHSYEDGLVEQENEIMEYKHTTNKSALKAGKFFINSESSELVKYTFSNAMALSVKLAIWESSLDSFVDSFESIAENMKEGKDIGMSRNQVFMKMGELFSLRHLINLSSDLLDTPDFYWDRHDLENLYIHTCSHLSTSKRTRVMNEKLNYCCELMELLSNHLNDKHHVRLEWMIIALIMIEVGFECLHYIERLL